MLGATGRCPNCGAPLSEYLAVDRTGKLVCRNCGYVFEEQSFDLGPEWRSFTEEDRTRRSRVGAPLTDLVHDHNLTTYIRASRGDPRSIKLAMLQARVRTHGNRRLIEVLQELNRAAAKLRVPPSVAETAARLVRKLQSMGIVKRNNIKEFVAASLFIAARINKHPLAKKDVLEALDLDEQSLWRATRTIYNKLEVRAPSAPRPSMFVPKLASRLGLTGEVEALSLRLTTMLERSKISQGKPPVILAAAALYVSSILLDKKKNQTTIARAIGVTDATIRNRYRDIVDNFYIEVRL